MSIETGGARHRTLIECKDYDLSGKKVPLSVVRDFRSVVEDIKSDRALVISTAGFTRDAAKFASSKGIETAVLREFENADWDGRARQIEIHAHLTHFMLEGALPMLADEADRERFVDALRTAGALELIGRDTLVFVESPGGRTQYVEFVNDLLHCNLAEFDDPPHEAVLPLVNHTIVVASESPIPLPAMKVTAHVSRAASETEVVATRLAVLILQGAADELGAIIWDSDLQKFTVDSRSKKVDARAGRSI